MGAAISSKETRFAGWMLLLSAVFITLSVPVAGTLNLLFLYMPAIVILGITAILCFHGTGSGYSCPEIIPGITAFNLTFFRMHRRIQ